MAIERKVTTGRKVYVPAPGKSAVSGKKVASHGSKNAAETPVQFYTRVSNRTDVRNILKRLAKD
jgi:hypothetical protein